MSTKADIPSIVEKLEWLQQFLDNEDKCTPWEEALPEELYARLRETREKFINNYGSMVAYAEFMDAFSWLRDTLYTRGDCQFIDEHAYREYQKSKFLVAQRKQFYEKLEA